MEAAEYLPLPVLSTDEILSKLKSNIETHDAYTQYKAMYSSIFGGVTTDPAMMLIPLDDHMVHRGHGVFDTALIIEGYLYEMDVHLDRLLASASLARITPPFDRNRLRNIIVETVSISECRNGHIRCWLSAGPGNFHLSSKGCICSSFYAVAINTENEILKPATVITSTIAMKPPQFATVKSVNYLPNALSQLEAEDKGAFAGIWVDDEGFIAEGPNVNVAFVNKAGELLVPEFDKILSGCTVKRTLALAHQFLEMKEQSCPLRSIRIGPISVKEGKNASEMMLIGSGLPIIPVIKWDQQQIGDGKPGPITTSLQNIMLNNMLHGPSTCRERVPYRLSK